MKCAITRPALLQVMNDAALLLHTDLKVFAVNNAFVKLLGLKEKQVIGTNFLELLGKFVKTETALKPLNSI
jgi:PAS domain-containing protein